MDLVDSSTGAPASVPDADATAAIKSGKYTFAKGAQVPIVNDVGRVSVVSADEAMAHLVKGGTVGTQAQAFEKAHEGVGSHLAALGEGAARGLSVGLSDPAAIEAARAIGGDESAEAVRKHLAEQKEAHPYLAGAGEVVGAVAPALLSGGATAEAEGAGLLARGAEAATALPRGLAEVGGAVERGVSAILPEADSLVGRALSKTVSGGAGAAVENAGWGVGQAISENSLNGGNHELTAEQLLAAAGHGALLGAAVGGLAHGLTTAASEALAEPAERMTGFLREQADRQAARTVGVTGDAAAELGGPRAVGRTLHEEGIFGDSLGSSAVKAEELAPRIEAAKTRAGDRIGQIIEKSDARMMVGDVVKPLDDIISTKLLAGDQRAAEALGGYREDLLKKLHASPEDLSADVAVKDVFRERKALESFVSGKDSALAPELKEFHAKLADTEAEALESEGHLGGELLALRNKYAHLEIAQKSLESQPAKGWSAGTGTLALAMGHPLAAGAVMAKAAVAERGGQVAAYALDKIHHIVTADRVVQDVSKQISQGMRGYISRTAEAVTRGAPRPSTPSKSPMSSRPLADRYARRVDEVRAMSSSPVATERLTKSLGSLATHAPKVSAAIATLATSDAQYLAGIIPPKPPPPSLLQPHLKERPPAESQMSQFLRLSTMLDKPLTAIDKLRKGSLLQDEADMLRARRPGLFGQMQEAAMTSISQRSSELPYEKRRALGVLLGIPTDASLAPDFVATMQASYAGRDEAPPTPHSGAKLNLVHESTMDKMEQGDGD